jgi:hypothetical protein
MNAVTINELFQLCREQIIKGNGSKKIMLSNDDEGNGYHELLYHFTEVEKAIGDVNSVYAPQLPHGVNKDNIKDYIVLG